MTVGSGDTVPGSWIGLGRIGANRFGPEAPLGYQAYAEVIHDAQASDPPDELPAAALRALLTILHGHTTSTPDTCFFGQWTLWGHLIRPTRVWTFGQDAAIVHEPEPRKELKNLRPLDQVLQLDPDYQYQLFTGPLQAAEAMGHWVSEDTFEAPSCTTSSPAQTLKRGVSADQLSHRAVAAVMCTRTTRLAGVDSCRRASHRRLCSTS